MPIVYAWMLGPEQIAEEVKDMLKRKGVKVTSVNVTTDETLGIRNWDISWYEGARRRTAHLDLLETTTLTDLRSTLSYLLERA